MKNRTAAAAATVLAATALVASPVAPSPAGAADSAAGRCGYTGCIHTVSAVSGPTKITRRGRPDISWRVRATGNAVPEGFVKVVVQANHEKYYRSWIVDFNGRRGHLTGDRIPKLDTYTVRVRFIPDSHSNFYGSGDRYHLRVVKQKQK